MDQLIDYRVAAIESLKAETFNALKSNGYSPEDIIFIGDEDGYSCDWQEFLSLIDRLPKSEVVPECYMVFARSLVILFKDYSYLKRGYDEMEEENWVYVKPFRIPEVRKPIKSIFPLGWGGATLSEIHKNLEKTS